MSSAEATGSPQLELVRSFIEGFGKRDVEHVAKLLHKDYRHIPRPRSVGRDVETREEWLRLIKELTSSWTDDCEPIIHSIIEAPGKVVTHVTSKAETSFGTEMNREMILTFHIVADEDGSLKIKDLENFIDSKTYLDFAKAVAAAKVNAQRYAA